MKKNILRLTIFILLINFGILQRNIWVSASNNIKVGTLMIQEVIVNGNQVRVVANDSVDGADGYDYIISTEEDYANGRVDIVKNVSSEYANFYYVDSGIYYAYGHAWRYDETGNKIWGEWSNLYKFAVYSITPSQPVITTAYAVGNTVTVTYTQSQSASGYDIVLGTETERVYGEIRPSNYGTLIKKVGNVTSVTFQNIPLGKYYVGVHAFNRTRTDNGKVFSKWSNIKSINVDGRENLKNQTISVPKNFTKEYQKNKKFSLKAHAPGKLSYVSKNPKIATVSSTGTVTMKSCGSTIIEIMAAETLEYKSISAQIRINIIPGKTDITYLKLGKKGRVNIKWKGNDSITKYEIQCCTNNKFSSSNTKKGYYRKENNQKIYSAVISVLAKNKDWYIRIRAYCIVDGKTLYGPWSNVKKIYIV